MAIAFFTPCVLQFPSNWTDLCFNLLLPKLQRVDHELFRSSSMFFAVVLCHLQYCTLLEGLETLLRRRTLYFTGCELQRLPHGSQIISKRVWDPSIPPLHLKASTRIHPKAKAVETCLKNVWVNKMKAAASTTSAYYTSIPPLFIRTHEHGKCLTLFGTCVVLMPFV
jgi:hypothetical protein